MVTHRRIGNLRGVEGPRGKLQPEEQDLLDQAVTAAPQVASDADRASKAAADLEQVFLDGTEGVNDAATKAYLSTPGTLTNDALVSRESVTLAGVASAGNAATTKVGPNSDEAAALTPDGRTRVTMLTGQSNEAYVAYTGGNGWDSSRQSADTTRVKRGTSSARFHVPAPGTYTTRVTKDITFGAASVFKVWVWVDDPSRITSIGFGLAGTGWSRARTGPFKTGWNLIVLRANEGPVTSWGASTATVITIATSAATRFNIGEAWVERLPKAQMVFVEDRGYKTFVEHALPDLRAINAPVVWALDPATHGTSAGTPSEVITDAQVAQFYAEGDDMSLHGYDGTVTSTKTPAQLREDSLKALAWLHERGYTRGSEWRAAWVQNNAPNHASSQPYFAGYATPSGSSATIECWPPLDKWNIGRYTLHGRTAEAIDTMFDTLQAAHLTAFVYTHGIHDTLSGAMTHAEWDYFYGKLQTAIAAGWLEVVTFSELMRRSEGKIRR